MLLIEKMYKIHTKMSCLNAFGLTRYSKDNRIPNLVLFVYNLKIIMANLYKPSKEILECCKKNDAYVVLNKYMIC